MYHRSPTLPRFLRYFKSKEKEKKKGRRDAGAFSGYDEERAIEDSDHQIKDISKPRDLSTLLSSFGVYLNAHQSYGNSYGRKKNKKKMRNISVSPLKTYYSWINYVIYMYIFF